MSQIIIDSLKISNLIAINNLKPQPINHFWDVNIQELPIERNQVRTYADYFKQILKVFPNMGDAYGILGYCYYYLGNEAQAVEYIEKAAMINTNYFWHPYNLAMIHLKNHKLSQAQDALKKALQINPERTLNTISSSQLIYLPLIDTSAITKIPFHLQEGYKNAIVLIKILNQNLPDSRVEELLKGIKLKLYAF